MFNSKALSEFLLVWSFKPQSLFDPWHKRNPYSSLVMNTVTPRAHGAVQNNQVCGIVCNYKQIFSINEARYSLFPHHHKTLELLFEKWDLCLFNFWIIYFNENNVVCYRKSLFDPKIQVWLDIADMASNMLDVEDGLVTQIYSASYPNDQLALYLSLVVIVEKFPDQLAQ